MRVFVIIPAAGLGTRMGYTAPHAAPKQFLELNGVPILIHSLRAFAAVPEVAAILVAARQTELDRVEAQVEEFGLDRGGFEGKVTVVVGGDTRQESVAHALAAIECAGESFEDSIVLVHDAVRPLIDSATILRTIEAVKRHGAAIVAVPAVDTIKQVQRTAGGAIITATIPREYIVQAQTPQGFRCHILKKAFAEAQADGFQGTDESSIVERAGVQVAVVMGSPENLKITHPDDLELAEFYLNRRSGHDQGRPD